MTITLRDYQSECLDAILGYFQFGGTGNPLVCLPTGTGKGLIIAEFIRRALQYFPTTRVISLVHVRELIEQTHKELMRIWPDAPAGIFSAGIGQRDTVMPIIFGGVASVVRNAEMFGHRDLMFIDEAHLLSPNEGTMYQKIIATLRGINPHMRVIGLTATWYRLGQGVLTDGGLFTDIAFNICDYNGFNRLIDAGWLCPPIPKRTKTQLDISQVSVVKGEFVLSEMQKAVDKHDVTYAALTELCEHAQNRKSWLIFCSGIEHAEHCADMLNSFGVSAAAVHSKISNADRDSYIKAFKAGELRAVTNNNVLTTGFDHPNIDLIGMLRPTMSPGLWVQMIGRGTRPAPGKNNCLVLDFAGNTKRLGPINDPVIPRPKGAGGGPPPIKLCDACGAYNHIRNRFCDYCGAEFIFEEKLVRSASTHELLRTVVPEVQWFNVNRVMYNRHIGRKSQKASIKVSYLCGLQLFHEYIGFDHAGGLALHSAREWWRQRHREEPPLSTDLALQRLMELRTPRRLKVWVNAEHPKVMGYEF